MTNFGGMPDPKIRFTEYKKLVRSGEAPAILEFLYKNQCIPYITWVPNVCSDITLEKISRPYAKGSFDWCIDFMARGFEVRVEFNIETNSSVAIKPLRMQLKEKYEPKADTYIFDEYFKPVPLAVVPVQQPVPGPTVRYNVQQAQFTCSCWKAQKRWCSHMENYINSGGDRAVLDIKMSDLACMEYDFGYTMARGRIKIVLTAQKEFFKANEDGGDDEVEVKLSFNDEIGIWLQPQDSGITVLRMIEEEVRSTVVYRNWQNMVGMGMVPRSYKCKNNLHSGHDNKKLNEMIAETVGNSDAQEELAFVLAYYEVYDNRCLSCALILSSIPDHVPSVF